MADQPAAIISAQINAVARERDELRAAVAWNEEQRGIQAKEIERLRASQLHCHCDADIIRNRDEEIERLRAALEEVKSYGHWSDCPSGASDKYRCRCPYGDLSEALGGDTE